MLDPWRDGGIEKFLNPRVKSLCGVIPMRLPSILCGRTERALHHLCNTERHFLL